MYLISIQCTEKSTGELLCLVILLPVPLVVGVLLLVVFLMNNIYLIS